MFALLLALATAMAGTRASSELSDEGGKRGALLAFDGLLKTGWAEGTPGSGEGSWLELDLGRATEIGTLSIWPGNLKDGARSYREYARPRLIQVYLDDQPLGGPTRLDDAPKRLDLPLGEKGAKVRGKKLKIEVKEVYEGNVFTDLYIAEIALDFPEAGGVGKLEGWLKSKDAERQQAAFEAQIEEKYQAYKAAQFGDSAALDFLADAVADGAPYLRERVRTLVTDGYRAQGVRSDLRAQEAVRKLKDPNAIPAFQMAQLRASGEEARQLQDVVEIFEAYQDLIGGGSRNVPYWGQSGWEPGALRGFDEPLDLAMDSAGNVYVADTGNNRVQMFAENGRPVKQWGPKADITDAWFERGRKWYVSGAAPGEGPGEFFNPLAVTVIPGKDGDSFAALDALGRVQVFGPDGKPTISWKVQAREKATPGLGGTSYLVWVPQKERLYVVIQDQAVGYTLDASEVVRWEIRDGTPKAACLGPGGKLLFAFGYEVVAYDPDGFRYGAVVETGVLGRGYEDIGLALDDEEKLWAITDIGEVTRFKKLGKPEFTIQAVNRPIRRPRLVVRDGLVYFASDDRIEVVDAFQAHLDQQAEEAEQAGGAGKGKGKGKGKRGEEE